jgi:hypothetical protein
MYDRLGADRLRPWQPAEAALRRELEAAKRELAAGRAKPITAADAQVERDLRGLTPGRIGGPRTVRALVVETKREAGEVERDLRAMERAPGGRRTRAALLAEWKREARRAQTLSRAPCASRVRLPRPRARARRPGCTRRTAASSRTSSADPGGGDSGTGGEGEPAGRPRGRLNREGFAEVAR